MDRMDHGPLRKKSGRARGCLMELVREGTERVHGPQQDRFARSRKALRRGAGGTGRRVWPRCGRSSRHPSASWDLVRSRETMAIPAFAGMTDMDHFASARRIVQSCRMIRSTTSICSRNSGSCAASLTLCRPLGQIQLVPRQHVQLGENFPGQEHASEIANPGDFARCVYSEFRRAVSGLPSGFQLERVLIKRLAM